MRHPTDPSRRRRGRAVWLVLACVIAASPAAAQPEHGSANPEVLVADWLLLDCEDGKEELQERLLQQADVAAELLLVAFREGPPDDLVARTERAAQQRFALRAEVLADPDALGFAPDERARLAAVSEKDYVKRRSDALRLHYRTQAVRGLLVVRPTLALSLLEDEADDSDSALQAIAARLLETHR